MRYGFCFFYTSFHSEVWVIVFLLRSLLFELIFIIIIIIWLHYYDFHISVSRWFSTEVLVTASLQDSSQYSGRSQQYCSLNSLHPSRYFLVPQSVYESFGDCTKSTNYY